MPLWIAMPRRYFITLTELAYKKHARSRRGDAGASGILISGLQTGAGESPKYAISRHTMKPSGGQCATVA